MPRRRKIREAILARRMEDRYTKSQIVTWYLNGVYFGAGAHGVQAAAQTFFGRDVWQLELHQIAMIIGVIPEPSVIHPHKDLQAARKAMDGVLDARVHVALPDTRRLALDDERPRPRASVLVRHRGPQPGYSDDAVRALVAGAVQDMQVEDVAVVGVPVEIREASRGERLVSVGPITVTRGSATALKGVLGGALALHVVLAGLLVLVLARRRRAVPPTPEPEHA